ncbi:MAG: DNA translocase FtsK [Candidatus Omnitrophica bacterium]|nr:DNA translocase FtsK [Candidatus Omnitrophota bacterium]
MKKDKRDLIISFGLFTLAFILFAAMISYTPYDIGFETSHPNLHARNFIGIVGAYASWLIFKIIGYSGFFIPFLLLVWGIGMLAGRLDGKPALRFTGVLTLFISSSTFFGLTGLTDPAVIMERGGLTGLFLSGKLVSYFGIVGGYIITLVLSVLALLLATEFLIVPLVSFLFVRIWGLLGSLKDKRGRKERVISERDDPTRQKPRIKAAVRVDKSRFKALGSRLKEEDAEKEKQEKTGPPKITIFKPKPVIKQAPAVPKKPVKIEPRVVGDYKMPTLDLLTSPPPESKKMMDEDLEANARILEDTLGDFNIEAKVVNISKGPVITRYELQPAPGVKVNRITALSDDIALIMKAPTVRIVAPIPGKSAVGIEVPNQSSTLVYLREILESEEYEKEAAKSKLAMALGKDISGKSVVADLGGMPHLLIAGTTGSGKTVCVNSLIMSMIYNASPDELKFIMVDPKMVELAVYNGLPHLLCPVVTDSRKAAGVLEWVVSEMESRYKMLAKAVTRNIDAFNKKSSEKLPYIVVIIDELADLMIVAQQDVENAITRLAQLSRAVGIHIILATQRPSVDVVTGVIKANFPARISFKVASKVDSRTVLDMNGADKLLGKGDMLFLEPGNAKPIRAQGTLLSDADIEAVVEMIKKQREPEYDGQILEQQKKGVAGRGGFSKDEFFDEAVQMVLETGQASVSMLQRRLRLGYTRAARLIDAMEEEGVVGSFRGSKPREILISEYKVKQEESGEAPSQQTS